MKEMVEAKAFDLVYRLETANMIKQGSVIVWHRYLQCEIQRCQVSSVLGANAIKFNSSIQLGSHMH